MGFTVVGPRRFLGSGHPDGRDNLPPFLGLIESRDAGQTWKPLSLQGRVDFHVLEAAGKQVYGFGSDWKTRRPRFLRSSDGGDTWTRLTPPESLIALVIDARGSVRRLRRTRSWSEVGSIGGAPWTLRSTP